MLVAGFCISGHVHTIGTVMYQFLSLTTDGMRYRPNKLRSRTFEQSVNEEADIVAHRGQHIDKLA